MNFLHNTNKKIRINVNCRPLTATDLANIMNLTARYINSFLEYEDVWLKKKGVSLKIAYDPNIHN